MLLSQLAIAFNAVTFTPLFVTLNRVIFHTPKSDILAVRFLQRVDFSTTQRGTEVVVVGVVVVGVVVVGAVVVVNVVVGVVVVGVVVVGVVVVGAFVVVVGRTTAIRSRYKYILIYVTTYLKS